MRTAQEFARSQCPDLSVDLVSVTLEGEEIQADDVAFAQQIELDRSVLDIKTFRVPRRLPLIFDIVAKPAAEPDDIFVYTNIDVSLVPQFYLVLAELFRRGADCAVLNRRTIAGIYRDASDLAIMSIEVGEPHKGFDCFAFRAGLRDEMVPFSSCIGMGSVMLPLLYSLLARAELPTVLLDAHATFHVGHERSWRAAEYSDYTDFNKSEVDRVFDALCSEPEVRSRLVERLQNADSRFVFPDRLRERVGLPTSEKRAKPRGSLTRALQKARKKLLETF